jgi:hypothetical protein
MISRSAQFTLSAALALVVVVALAACGGGGHASSSPATTTTATSGSTENASHSSSTESGDETIATVSGTPITRAQVNNWMTALGGNVYYFVSHTGTAPEGLVSDPPDYGRCVATLEAGAAKSPLGHARESATELLGKCRELYTALKIEATTYLISSQRAIQLGKLEGVTVTPAQAEQLFLQTKAREYPTEALLTKYLTSRHMTLSDLQTEAKLDLISQAVYKRITSSSRATAQYTALEKQLVAATSCQPGYVVGGCKQFKGGPLYPTAYPPSALMEQVYATLTDGCWDLRGCGKQIGKPQ